MYENRNGKINASNSTWIFIAYRVRICAFYSALQFGADY